MQNHSFPERDSTAYDVRTVTTEYKPEVRIDIRLQLNSSGLLSKGNVCLFARSVLMSGPICFVIDQD